MVFDIQSILVNINELFTFYVVFPSIILLGAFLTFRLNFVQIFKLKLSVICLLKKDKNAQGNISHYQAISSVLAGNFGTGNISGMAIALTTGGPGALVWMWVMAFLGAAIQYTSCILGVKYRHKNQQGEFVGGPMYYLRDGLGFKKTGILFSIFTILGSLTVGNFAQINSISLPLEKMGASPLATGLTMAIFVAIVLVGSVQRVAKLASVIVPVKAFIYLLTALIILGMHASEVIPALQLMYKAAFQSQAFLGGAAGFTMIKAITSGFDRGIFATDAGTGIVPILQSSAKTTNPVLDGVVTLIAPFLVMIVCTTTGLVLLVTGVWQDPHLKSTNMVTQAFSVGIGNPIGGYIVIGALVLFAYTTILAWACCAEQAVEYIAGNRMAKTFKYLYIALIPIGSLIHVDMIWRLADISISFMVITNLIGISLLSKEVIQESHRFFANSVTHSNSLIMNEN